MYDIHFRAVHLEGSQNRLADYLSRFHLDSKFKGQFLSLVTNISALSQCHVNEEHFRFTHPW